MKWLVKIFEKIWNYIDQLSFVSATPEEPTSSDDTYLPLVVHEAPDLSDNGNNW